MTALRRPSLDPVFRPLVQSRRTWLLFAAFWTSLAALWTAGSSYRGLARGRSAAEVLPLAAADAVAGAASWAVVCAACFAFAWLFPLSRKRPLHALAWTAAFVAAALQLRLLPEYALARWLHEVPRLPPYPRFALDGVNGGLHIIAAYLAAGFSVTAVLRERERRAALARLEAEVAEERFRALSAQLRPGFLFGALRDAREAMERDPAGAERVLATLSEMLRLTFRSAAAGSVPLAQEVGLALLFAEVQHARGAAPVRVRSTVPAPLRGARVPHLGVFPLVESAVLCAGDAAVRVTVSAREEEGVLAVEVSDDGPVPAAERRGHPGWEPVSLLERRLGELPGGAGRLVVAGLPGGGVAARLSLPLGAP